MKVRFLIAIILAAIVPSAVYFTGRFRRKPLTVTVGYRVIDDRGVPVSDAAVTLSTYAHFVDHISIRTTTDSRGRVEVDIPVTSSPIEINVRKDGYYATPWVKVPWSEYFTRNASMDENGSYPVLLKRRRNPVPMYAQRHSGSLPEGSGPFGFDLKRCDWKEPLGTGGVADLIFDDISEGHPPRGRRIFRIRFSNPGDGMIKFPLSRTASNLKSDYLAPDNGYEPGISIDEARTEMNIGYYFRVRTSVNQKGEIETANYGKIYGGFPQASVYFNPQPNNRNIEFNPARNLMLDLKSSETVTEP